MRMTPLVKKKRGYCILRMEPLGKQEAREAGIHKRTGLFQANVLCIPKRGYRTKTPTLRTVS